MLFALKPASVFSIKGTFCPHVALSGPRDYIFAHSGVGEVLGGQLFVSSYRECF